jgi:hypothetical protein
MPRTPAAALPTCNGDEPSPRRIWRLTTTQYERSLVALFPGAAGLAAGFTAVPELPNRADLMALGDLRVQELIDVSYGLASRAVASPALLHPCARTAAVDEACVRQIVTDFGRRVFRRPLVAEEIARYVGFFGAERQRLGPERALRQVLVAFIASPHFLFRTEIGPPDAPAGASAMTPHERASALSYALTDAPPDAELAAAADGGALAAPTEIEKHARRLLGQRGAAGPMQLWEAYLGVSTIDGLTKDAKALPGFSPELGRDMAEETRRFFQEVFWSDGGRLGALIGSRVTFVTDRLARIYGLPAGGPSFRKVTLKDTERAGFLTQPALMTRLGTPTGTDIVMRGKFVRERVLCGSLPAPPPDVPAIAARIPGQSERERHERHSADPACAGCHQLMDPLGIAFETLDGLGRYRASEEGRPINARSAVTGTSLDGPVDGPVELAGRLAAAPETAGCFARQIFRAVWGRNEAGGDACALAEATDELAGPGGNFPDAIVALFVSKSAFVRR